MKLYKFVCISVETIYFKFTGKYAYIYKNIYVFRVCRETDLFVSFAVLHGTLDWWDFLYSIMGNVVFHQKYSF